MPIINRLPINSNNDDKHYGALVTRQTRNNNYDNARNYDSFSIGKHGIVIGRGNNSHNNSSYISRKSKTG